MTDLALQAARPARAAEMEKLRGTLEAARAAASALAAEAEAYADELGTGRRDLDRSALRPGCVLARLAALRLARLRSGKSEPTADERKLADRRDLLESALLGLRPEGDRLGQAARTAQDELGAAVLRYELDYPTWPGQGDPNPYDGSAGVER